jgi:hypothetical protein
MGSSADLEAVVQGNVASLGNRIPVRHLVTVVTELPSSICNIVPGVNYVYRRRVTGKEKRKGKVYEELNDLYPPTIVRVMK